MCINLLHYGLEGQVEFTQPKSTYKSGPIIAYFASMTDLNFKRAALKTSIKRTIEVLFMCLETLQFVQ